VMKIDIPATASSPTWSTLETCIREQVQTCLQRVLDDEVEALLGRGRHERRAADAVVGYRNGHGQPRQVALLNGTISIRRPRVRGLLGDGAPLRDLARSTRAARRCSGTSIAGSSTRLRPAAFANAAMRASAPAICALSGANTAKSGANSVVKVGDRSSSAIRVGTHALALLGTRSPSRRTSAFANAMDRVRVRTSASRTANSART
jgi:hypothetical protein